MGELVLIVLAIVFAYLLFMAKRSSAKMAMKKRNIVNKIRQRER